MTTTKVKRECCSCINWQRDGADGICRGTCPEPRIMPSGERYTVIWPRTNAEDFCGEWEGKSS